MKSRTSAKLPRNVVLVGDGRRRLAELPDASVDCVVTSPPYFLLRNYEVQGQIGLEENIDEWVNELRLVMGGIARVLKPSGSLWLNLGDTYSRHWRFGAPPKSLLLGPERLAVNLIEDGWTIRNKIIWAKSNGMPSSVRDRLSCNWEVIYLLTRNRDYHFDLDGIRVPQVSMPPKRRPSKTEIDSVKPKWAGPLAGSNVGLKRLKASGLVGHPLGKNPGDVWQLAAANFRGQHFATFPPMLVNRILRAGCPQKVCRSCGRPWTLDLDQQVGHLAVNEKLRPACRCRNGWQPGIVLDPFFGAGTVGLVAESLERDWLGIELNPEFARLAQHRIDAARQVGEATTHDQAA